MSEQLLHSHFPITRHVRISQFGLDSTEIQQKWLALHGYGQLPRYFIQKFSPLNNQRTAVVAPEGMHRFYLNGFSGRVGASWMTKEDRLSDIADNHHYLNMVWETYFNGPQKKIAVGFSQGAATLIRWACQAPEKPHHLIVWSGSFPEDLNWFEDVKHLNKMNLLFMIGDEDEFISSARFDEQSALLRDKGLIFDTIRFKGGHDILPEVLLELYRSF